MTVYLLIIVTSSGGFFSGFKATTKVFKSADRCINEAIVEKITAENAYCLPKKVK